VTGFPKRVRDLIHARARGVCEHCAFINVGLQIHHRRPRGMGGSKDPLANTAANGVLVCERSHRFIESYRHEHLETGWLVRQGVDPATVPIFRHKQWVLLGEDGGVNSV
jgi:5-methylcytosine-specific restriction enzyme A